MAVFRTDIQIGRNKTISPYSGAKIPMGQFYHAVTQKKRLDENLSRANAQAEQYRQEAERSGGIGNIAVGTVTGIPKAIYDIGKQGVTHPIRTSGAVATGVYEGALKPLLQLATPKRYEGIYDIGMKSENPVEEGLRQGFEFSGAVAPYSLATKGVQVFANIPKVAKMAPWLSKSALAQNLIGNVSGGQLLTEENTSEGRAKQAALDTLLFGMTNVGSIKKGLSQLSSSTTKIRPSTSTTKGAGTVRQTQAIPKNLPDQIQSSQIDISAQQPGARYRDSQVPFQQGPSEYVSQPSYMGAVKKGKGSNEYGLFKTIKESDKTSKQVADALEGGFNTRNTAKLTERARNLIIKNPTRARDIAMTRTDDEAVAVGMELIKEYQKVGDFDSAVDIASTLAPKLTELGRSIQAVTLYNRLSPEGIVRFATKEMQKSGMELTGAQAKELVELATNAKNLSGEARTIATQQMLDRLAEFVPTPLIDKATTIWKAGLLTNPTTQLANLTGNTSMLALENIKDVPATGYDMLMSLFTGKRSKGMSNFSSQLSGAKEGFRKANKFFATGTDVDNVLAKYDYNKVNFSDSIPGKLAKKYTDTIFRGLGYTDKVFRETVLKKSLFEQAKIEGMNKGLKGTGLRQFVNDIMKSPPIKMLETAVEESKYATFQSQNALGDAAHGLKRGLSKLPGGKEIGEVLMPFVQTPSNVAMRIADYSPIGLVKAGYQGATGAGQRAVAESLGRATVGTGIAGLGYAMGDNMTGAIPTNETERNLWEIQGKQPNSMRMGDKYYNLEKISPVGNLLSMGANFRDLEREKQGVDLYASALGNTARGLTEQTFLQGLSSGLGALTDPERNAESFLKQTISGTVPSILAAGARTIDPVKRSTKEGFLDPLKNRIPFVKDSLPENRNAFGETQYYEGNQFFNPFRPTQVNENPAAQELERFRNAGSDLSLSKFTRDEISVGKIKLPVTPEDRNEMQRIKGGIIDEAIGELANLPDYQMLSDSEKEKIVKKIIDKATETAKIEIFKKKAMEKISNPFFTTQ